MLKRVLRATRSRRVSLVVGGAVLVLAAVSTACTRSDEDRIRRRLDELAQTVSIEDRETPLIRQARATRLTTYMTPDATIDVGAPFSPVAGRDAALRVVAAVRVPAGGVTVEFTDVRVTVDIRTRQALAIATAVLTSGVAFGGDEQQMRELNMVFSEIDGEWLVEHVRPVGVR